MAITNQQIAEVLYHIAETLEEHDENPYRVRAYRKAANSLKKYPGEVHALESSALIKIPHIGKKISALIQEMLLTNNLDIQPKFIGPTDIPFKMLKKQTHLKKYRIYSVIRFAEKIFTQLNNMSEIEVMEFAGDYRRKKELLDEIIIVIVTKNVPQVFDKFMQFPSIKYLIVKTNKKLIVQLKMGVRLTVYVVKKEEFAVNLLRLTGSTEHYQALKNSAKAQSIIWKNNSLHSTIQKLHFSSEADIYHELQLDFIPPELRENRGEVDCARKHILPVLVQLSDIKGDLHCHTTETDGSFTLEEMVEAAQNQGYQYLAITDHSKSLKIAHGMDEKRLLKQIKKINQLNEKLSDFTILKSMEVDILEDGSLDLSNEVLQELDLTVCSIHSKFHLSFEKQTERIIRAMDNPYFNILGHATGRLLTHRPPYPIDVDRILLAAKEHNCFIEVNSQPARLDINDEYCKKAKEIGVKVAISSDAHTAKGFQFMILGIYQARRGWLETKDVINTYPLQQLKKLFKRR